MKKSLLASLLTLVLVGCGSDSGDSVGDIIQNPTTPPTTSCDDGSCLEDDGFTNPDLPLTDLLPPTTPPTTSCDDGSCLEDDGFTHPDLPSWTLKEFADLIGEPEDKLKVLFSEGSYLGWYVDSESKPFIFFRAFGYEAPHNFVFNLYDQTMKFGGVEYVQTGDLTFHGINRVFTYSTGDYDFNTVILEHAESNGYVRAAVEMRTDLDLMQRLLQGNESVMMSIQYDDGLSEMVHNFDYTLSFFFLDSQSHKDYLLEILNKH